MDANSVEASYARWAPIYDFVFGRITQPGRRRATAYTNARQGTVLEVGVGTGLALPLYAPHLRVTGIDFSADMLDRARDRLSDGDWPQVAGLRRMDAQDMAFPDASFDTVVAMHVLSVVPDPDAAMQEIVRVCKPGGRIVITNHFRRDTGLLARIESVTARFAAFLGWDAAFGIERVTGHPAVEVIEQATLPPLGLMTYLVLEKRGRPLA